MHERLKGYLEASKQPQMILEQLPMLSSAVKRCKAFCRRLPGLLSIEGGRLHTDELRPG